MLLSGDGILGTFASNAPLEMNLAGSSNLFDRPLGSSLGTTLGLGDAPSDTVASTSPSPGGIFAEPVFTGLQKFYDGSPEDPAVLSSSATLGGI